MGINSCVSVTTQPRESIRPVLTVRIIGIISGYSSSIVALQLNLKDIALPLMHQRPSVADFGHLQ
jgi:hypothetical protein